MSAVVNAMEITAALMRLAPTPQDPSIAAAKVGFMETV